MDYFANIVRRAIAFVLSFFGAGRRKYGKFAGVTYTKLFDADVARIDFAVFNGNRAEDLASYHDDKPWMNVYEGNVYISYMLFDPYTGILHVYPATVKPKTPQELYADLMKADNPVQFLIDQFGFDAKVYFAEPIQPNDPLFEKAVANAVAQGKAYTKNAQDIFAELTGFKVY